MDWLCSPQPWLDTEKNWNPSDFVSRWLQSSIFNLIVLKEGKYLRRYNKFEKNLGGHNQRWFKKYEPILNGFIEGGIPMDSLIEVGR